MKGWISVLIWGLSLVVLPSCSGDGPESSGDISGAEAMQEDQVIEAGRSETGASEVLDILGFDGAMDTVCDVPVDALLDVPLEIMSDSAADALSDATQDISPDAAPDASFDAALDASFDTAPEKPCEVASGALGCAFWTLDLDNYPDPMSSVQPDLSPHGVALANPGTLPANVGVEAFGLSAPVFPETVLPGESVMVELPVMSLDGGGKFLQAVRIVTDRPVGATQWNPVAVAAASNGASRLYPEISLGLEYRILTWPTVPLEQAPVGDFPSQHGYFTVLAVMPGTTVVQVTVPVAADGPDGQVLAPGSTTEFTLAQGEALNLQADGASEAGDLDLSGALVVADKAIAVFSGHEEAAVCGAGAQDICCADHMEAQLLPVALWSLHVPCVKAKPRVEGEMDVWRVIAAQDATALQTEPSIEGLDGVTLDAGQWVEVATTSSFVIQASSSIQVMQYLSGKECGGQIGDPAQINLVPLEGFSPLHAVHVGAWAQNHATVIRTAGVSVELDGSEVNAAFLPLGDGALEYAYLDLDPGYHSIEADAPVGVYIYGFSSAAGYGY